MSAKASKRKINTQNNTNEVVNTQELFVDAPPDESGNDSDADESDVDTTDSEESEFSGLEEEEDDEEEDEGEESDDEEESSEDEELDEEESDSVGSEESDREEDTKNNNEAGPSTSREILDNRPKKSRSKKKEKLDNAVDIDVSSVNISEEGSKVDEYDADSSDEEDIRNTVGNIPMEWYKELAHIGYDLEGKPIGKPKMGDELDEFLNKMDNPDYWRTVKDKMTGQNVRLTDADVEMVQRMKSGKYVDPSFDAYQPWVDFFTFEKMIHPLTNVPAAKASFIPSKWEKMKVSKLVHAIKMGWIKPKPPKKDDEEKEDPFYQLWADDDQNDITRRYRDHMSAPKLPLPGHAESYNPPPEYLMTEEEKLAWKEKEPETRRLNIIPQKYDCLRRVPAYSDFIKERFQRCLDLYLCPRQRKIRMNVDPEDLIPKLPKPKDLQPFPTTQSIVYRGHTSLIRSISTEPNGQWLVSGSDDNTIKFWEVSTGRCMKTLKVSGVVKCVAWNPNPSFSLVAAVVDNDVIVINPGLGDKLICSNTDNMIQAYEEISDKKLPVEWSAYQGQEHEQGLRIKVSHAKSLQEVVWHARGDYFAIVQPDAGSMSVLIHQLSKRRTQHPFKKKKGLVQRVAFHPTRPFLVVATQRYVRIYNLLKQELAKKLMTNCKWISCLAMHPGGDNMIIGSYDCKLTWFDLDLSSKPYQTLRHHKKAIRQVAYHQRYPLFSSASDDGSVIVFHGKVYNDLLQNPLIVPVKVLRGHEKTKNLGVLSCAFHPMQPWLFSSASDNTIRLFT